MLLDVNVLLALAWPNHQFHDACRRWFERRRKKGWSTCAITELGFIRISSNPSFTDEPRTPAEAAALLEQLTAVSKHRYLGCVSRPSTLSVEWAQTAGHRQTTDVYLAALAAHHETKLATLDRKLAGIPALGGAVEIVPASA